MSPSVRTPLLAEIRLMFAWLLERIITQLPSFVPAHLTNTHDYLQRIKTQFPSGIPSGTIKLSVDVTNLFWNAPSSEAVEVTLRFIKRHIYKVDTFGLNVQDFQELLPNVSMITSFAFCSHIIRANHCTGVAFDTKTAPPMAIFFMGGIE